MRLFHFSSEGGIEKFVPRAPSRHPDSQAPVYAIDERHCPIYLFPRECPRIAVWDPDDQSSRISLYIDKNWETIHAEGHIFRYEFDPTGFLDCQDHGVWTNPLTVKPVACLEISDLRKAIRDSDAQLTVVDDLKGLAQELYDYEEQTWKTKLHVSMVRMSNLENWDLPRGKPILPRI